MKRYRGTSEAQLLKATADLGDLFDTHKETLEAKADELKRTCSAHMDRASAIWERIAGTWVRAVLLCGFILLGVLGGGRCRGRGAGTILSLAGRKGGVDGGTDRNTKPDS